MNRYSAIGDCVISNVLSQPEDSALIASVLHALRLVLHFINTETCVRLLEKRKSIRIAGKFVICDWLFVICYLTT